MRELESTLRARAREMRTNPTRQEAILWNVLRGGSLGARFRRQHVLTPYIVDFYAPAHRLAIEIDGGVHDDRRDEDARRAAHLHERHGVRTLRFTNQQVQWRLGGVTASIRRHLDGADAARGA